MMTDKEKQDFMQSEALKRMTESDKERLIIEWSMTKEEKAHLPEGMSRHMQRFLQFFLDEKKNLDKAQDSILDSVNDILNEN